MSTFAKSFATAALGLSCAWAQATTFDLNLTGTVASATSYDYDVGDIHVDLWSLNLDGLNNSNAIAVQNADIINTTISLDTAYTMPASVLGTFFVFQLKGSSFPAITTSSQTTTTLFLGAAPVLTHVGTFGTNGQLSGGMYLVPPDNLAYTFDKVVIGLTIVDLASPATLDGSDVYITRFSPAVPEPGTWALMGAGMGVIGLLMRRRKNASRTGA